MFRLRLITKSFFGFEKFDVSKIELFIPIPLINLYYSMTVTVRWFSKFHFENSKWKVKIPKPKVTINSNVIPHLSRPLNFLPTVSVCAPPNFPNWNSSNTVNSIELEVGRIWKIWLQFHGINSNILNTVLRFGDPQFCLKLICAWNHVPRNFWFQIELSNLINWQSNW